MHPASVACPHCGSLDPRVLSDAIGSVGWCRACHRTWEATQQRLPRRPRPPEPVPPARLVGKYS